jgi:hypothetical protein
MRLKETLDSSRYPRNTVAELNKYIILELKSDVWRT